MPLLTQGLNDLDEVALGLKIDPTTTRPISTSSDGEERDETGRQVRRTEGRQDGVRRRQIPDAAVVISKTQMLTDDDLAQTKTGLAMFQKMFPATSWSNQGLPEDQINLISKLSGRRFRRVETDLGDEEDRRRRCGAA